MIYICAYRDWALGIYNQIKGINCKLINSRDQLNNIKFNNDDVIFFIGWSWMVKDYIINNNRCICLHPSPLPKYRGGSPIQHQIINGEKDSAVTFFIMNDKLDAGEILYQEKFSLEGELSDIFNRIISIGSKGLLTLLHTEVKPIKQDELKATYYKRRKPEESEITIDEIKNKPTEYLYNKIRMLNDPYPNAYIKCKDGSKLYITKSHYK
jgi:methionyl-tRNA formyltransferase|tara:strand:+ start:666 stop:1295 length:630 start_codon:yes stop_codon:yes gene_type:complete